MAEFDIVQPKHHDVYSFISTTALTNAAKDRSILIVGGGSGIGKAAAISFANAGASNVVLTGRRPSKLEDVKTELNNRFPQINVLPIAVDSSDVSDVGSLFAQIKDAGIVLDVLINSAGLHLNSSTIIDSDPELWWKEYEIMLKGPYLTTRAFLRSLPKSDINPEIPTRAIVNLSSLASNCLLPLCSAYGVIKSALNRLTEWTATEATGLGVQAIALHPGGIPDTDMTSEAPDWAKALNTETAELAGQTILYLSTNDAAYLNGRWIDARWDMEDLKSREEDIVRGDLLKTSILGAFRMQIYDEVVRMMTAG